MAGNARRCELLVVQEGEIPCQIVQGGGRVLVVADERGPFGESVEVPAIRLHGVVGHPPLGLKVVSKGPDVGLEFGERHGITRSTFESGKGYYQ